MVVGKTLIIFSIHQSLSCRSNHQIKPLSIYPKHQYSTNFRTSKNIFMDCNKFLFSLQKRQRVIVVLPPSFPYIRIRCKNSGCGSARLERLPWAQEAGGSNPLTPTYSYIFYSIFTTIPLYGAFRFIFEAASIRHLRQCRLLVLLSDLVY